MVTSVTSLTGNGLRDWLIQRVSAVYLLVYILALLSYFGMHRHLDYVEWTAFFHCNAVKIATVLALWLLVLHAWIGIWTIITDYIKPFALRLVVQILIMIGLFLCFIWGLMIIWGQ